MEDNITLIEAKFLNSLNIWMRCVSFWALHTLGFWSFLTMLACSDTKKRRVLLFGCCCSVAKSCPTLHNPMDCSMSGFPVLHYFLEFAQTHVHWVSDAIQISHPLLPPSPLALNLSQQQGLFQWVSSLHQVAKVLELQLQYQSFQWIFRVDFL